MTLSPGRRVNLDKLATYLEKLPLRYKHFDMTDYIGAPDTPNIIFIDYAQHNGGLEKQPCGTVACAIGHGPAAGVYMSKALATDRSGWDMSPDWSTYSLRKFAPLGPEWDWMFDNNWSPVDNSHRGAAARIRFLLAGNSVPEDFKDTGALKRHVKLYKEFKV